MQIEHLAIWTTDLEKLKLFYVKYFKAKAGELYFNPKKNFKSYFLSFAEGPRLELMETPDLKEMNYDALNQFTGLAHFAVSVGSKGAVDQLTEKLRAEGILVVGEPRTTGDGYYESVVLDPDGNRIEITV